MATIIHNGTKLAYEDRGAGKPTFVFVHGWTCNRSFFAPQAAHFAPQHRVVSIDLRGHGESDKPQGPYPRAQAAHDPCRVLTTLAHLIDRDFLREAYRQTRKATWGERYKGNRGISLLRLSPPWG